MKISHLLMKKENFFKKYNYCQSTEQVHLYRLTLTDYFTNKNRDYRCCNIQFNSSYFYIQTHDLSIQLVLFSMAFFIIQLH